MGWLKVLITILASAWFMPASCSLSLYAGTHINAVLDARDASKGDTVHSEFSVVTESVTAEEPFLVMELNELRRVQALPASGPDGPASFLMSNPGGHKRGDLADYSYEVLEETGSAQLIEVVETYHDGDNTIWSRYKATRSDITPISSRMFYFGYMFTAFPYAIIFSLLVFLAGRYLKSRMHES